MKTITAPYRKVKSCEKPSAICLGYFDGLHIGHQFLINYAKEHSKLPVGVLTFDQPISKFINNGKSQEMLTSLTDRFEAISKLNVDFFYIFQIDKRFINLTDEKFIILLNKMNIKEVYVGEDYRYGKNASGTIEKLAKNFKVTVVDIKNVNNEKVDTQKIISYIKEGNIFDANSLLGKNYKISGEIIKGQQIGTKIGFPTINIKRDIDYVVPKFGVYKTVTYVDNVAYASITNIGNKPTVNKTKEFTIETHLINFSGEIQNKHIEIEFVDFIRPEVKFDSLEDLKKQIALDVRNLL